MNKLLKSQILRKELESKPKKKKKECKMNLIFIEEKLLGICEKSPKIWASWQVKVAQDRMKDRA